MAYQYTVLPFGLSLAPRTFTKCMDAALSPLRQMGIRILNYLDDWLILAQSEVELLSHRTLILSHLERLGLRVNFAKSALSPSQRVSFLGTVLDSARMRAVIAPERALAIQKLATTFKSDTARPLKVFQRMLGLMAAASPVWRIPHNAWRHGRLHIRVNQACVTALTPWKNPRWMEKGVAMGLVHTRKVVTTDASNTGWGALCEGKPTFGHWSKAEKGFHINCLEMLAVCRACQFFLPDLIGRHVLIRSDNMSVVSYINHQGGVSSKRLFILAERLLEWAQLNLRSLRAAHLPGRLNQGADMLSRSNVPSEEWMLHPQVVQKIWKIFGKAEVDLFASKDNSHCPIYYLLLRVGPRLAQPPPLCIPPDRPASTGRQACQGTGSQGAIGGPLVEEPTLVVRADSATDSSPLARALETGSPLSGERNNMAPSTRAVGSLHLAAQREPTGLPERVLNTISEARAPSTRRLYALKWSVFSTW